MRRLLIVFLLMMSVVMAQTVDFDTEIQPIFDANCVGCHGVNGGLSLATGQSFNNLVNVSSQGYSPAFRVASGDISASVLYNKIVDNGTHGGLMPPSGGLAPIQISKITTWITELSTAPPTPISIAEARGKAEGVQVTVQGIITATTWGTVGSSTQAAIQDDTGGLVIYAGGFDKELTVGDDVIVTGVIDLYGGLVEVAPIDPDDIDIVSSGNDLPAIQNLTVPAIVDNGLDYESEFVHLDSLTIVGGTWPTTSSSVNMTVADVNGVTLTMRIDGDTDLHMNEIILGHFNFSGIVGRYNDAFQIFPRYYSDLEQVGDPAPQISNVHRNPASPTPTDDVLVEATIVDNGTVAAAAIDYTVDGGTVMTVAMVADGDDMYSGTIPPQAGLALVRYTVTATDDLGTEGTSSEFSYIVYNGVVTSIASIQNGDAAVDSIVTIQGIVTAESYAFYPADDLKYYFIQDDYAPLSGIKIYDPGRGTVEGDEIRITGTVTEYNGDLTELITITSYEVLSSGNIMDPLLVTLDADMEQYEGCLIEVTGVSVANPDLGYGEWSVSDGTNTLVLDDAADYYYTPVQDEALASIVGVLDYSFGAFKLLPRLAWDIQTDDDLTRIQAIQQVRYSDLMPHYSGLDSSLYFRDTSYYFRGWTDTMIVTVEGIVTMPTGLSYAGNGVKFILQDVNGGPWSSILSYHPDSSAFPVLFEGDLVQLTGYIDEFTTDFSAMTEFFISQDPVLVNYGQPIPAEPIVKTGDLRWPTTAEQWGNVSVVVQDAEIIINHPESSYDMMLIDDGTGSVNVDDDSYHFRDWRPGYPGDPVYIQPPVGSIYESVRAWVYDHYGSYDDSTTYKLVPLYHSDMVLSTVAIDNMQMPQGYALGNYPNPFNPTTNIAFRVPEAQQVSLVIYNQLGQHVVTLMDQSVGAGDYEVPWKGLDAKGRPVSSGLYFYRLIAGTKQMVGKMTYLK
jgi:DNA/RNA endonuclease YhcR with UshA esterase domain